MNSHSASHLASHPASSPPRAGDSHQPLPRIADRAFPPEVFARRRARVLDALRVAGGGIAIVASAPTATRSRDTDHPYRQNSDFFYLSGFTEPDALLVLDSRGAGSLESPSVILFCREKDADREIWEGFHYGPDAARSLFGLDAAFPNGERDTRVPALLDGASTLHYPIYAHTQLDTDVPRWIASVLSRRGAQAPKSLHDLAPLVEDMRLVKDATELDRMRAAARISAQAHIRAMQASRPGLPEYAIEAELLYEFRRHGAQAPAYSSIVAAGANACVLHYPAGDKILEDGDLVLIDAACELDGYASDITRTFPANGRFSGPQRALYDIVVEANRAAAAVTRAGARFDDGHQAALRVLAQGMLDTGLLRRNDHGSVDDVIADRAYARFYMHRTGHWLGLDVHDCGAYTEASVETQAQVAANAEAPEASGTSGTSDVAQEGSSAVSASGNAATASAPPPPLSRTLQAGMVLTIEPGLYVRRADDVPPEFWDIGIRVEDDAVVTEQGCELITRDVPVDADQIEALMRDGR